MSDYLVHGDPVKAIRPLSAEGGLAIPAGSAGRVDRVSDLFNPATQLYEGHYGVRFRLDGDYVWAECWHSEVALDTARGRHSLLAGE